MDGIKERFELLINEFAKGNKRAFSKAIGVSPTVVENVVGVRNGKPSFDVLQKIIYAFENINPGWLLTGNGTMHSISGTLDAPDIANFAGIPLIPLEAMAGFASGDRSVMEYECERYIIPMFNGADFLISVKGSSMMPKYNSGDVVACKNLPLDNLFFQWNKVYVLDTIQGALVKRIHKGSDAEHVLIVSDNKQYEPFELHRSQIRAVALVIGVIRIE